jgi:Hsp20/alpha crystallin family protein
MGFRRRPLRNLAGCRPSYPIDSQSFLLVVAFVVPQLDVRKGEKNQGEEEKGDNFYRCERSYGSFERSLRLPDTIDEAEVDAKFDKGVLTIMAAKAPMRT